MSKSILLVDDEPVILKSLARLLSYHHYEVYTANSGDEAIKALSLFDIVMVITDFRMPNMNGSELLEEIQKKDSNIVGVILSGYTDYDMLVETLNKRVAYKFISKPFKHEEILTLVQEGLEEYQLRKYLSNSNDSFLHSNEALIEIDKSGGILKYNKYAQDIFPNLDPSHLIFLDFTKGIDSKDFHHFLISDIKSFNFQSNCLQKLILNKRFSHKDEFFVLSIEHINDVICMDHVVERSDAVLSKEKMKNLIAVYLAENKSKAFIVFSFCNLNNIANLFSSEVCEQITREIMKKLFSALDSEDRLCNLTCNRFGILTSYDNANFLYKKIITFHNLFENPIVNANSPYDVECSVGFTVLQEDSDDASSLIEYAIFASIENEESEGSFFTRFSYDVVEARNRKALIAEALMTTNFIENCYLVFQPKYCSFTHKIIGAEALIRWRDPKLGDVSPAEFVPIAEQCGKIKLITEYVVEKSVFLLSQVDNIYPQNSLSLSVNFSGLCILNKEMIANLESNCIDLDINFHKIIIEITETYLIKNMDLVKQQFNYIHNLGFRTSLDDFGTGYSSLSYFTELTVDEVKIDRSILMSACANERSEEVYKNIITMAHSAGVKVVTEGVETKSQLELTKRNNNDVIQGFIFSKPVRFDELIDLLKDNLAYN